MKPTELKHALNCALTAARAAGKLMRQNLAATKRVNLAAAHDIKLELDVRCQKLIERQLAREFPQVAFLGEEGNTGADDAAARWVVDPIDGTVNYAYGIPHACVCIALQVRSKTKAAQVDGGYATVLGVIYDPFMDEMWSAVAGDKARLNGKPIRVSPCRKLGNAMTSMGYGKDARTLAIAFKMFRKLSVRVRKVRNLGSAGLALTYVACGRFDAYIERGISIWDIAAGGFIVEQAGGEFWRAQLPDGSGYRLIASNGKLRRQIELL